MGGNSDIGGASTPQGISPTGMPNFGQQQFGQKPMMPPQGPQVMQPPMSAPRQFPTAPGPTPIQPTGMPPRQPGYDPGKPQPGPGYAQTQPTGLPQRKPDDPIVKPTGPISAGNAGLGGLAQAFMGNQATQGATLPQIMQAPQSAMPDIAAMLAQRRPGVQPVPPPVSQVPGISQPGQPFIPSPGGGGASPAMFAAVRRQQMMDGGDAERRLQRQRRRGTEGRR